MQIDFYYWADCPSHEEALRRLEQVLSDEGRPETVQIHNVITDEESAALRFPGSPTIRLDGRDIDPAGAAEAHDYSLACRVYRTEDGRITPLPPISLIRDAIRAASGP